MIGINRAKDSRNVRETPDSDPSISDEEEEFDHVWAGHCVSLGGHDHASSERKDDLPLPWRLEILRGEQSFSTKPSDASLEKQTSMPDEEEVEMPCFDKEENFCPSLRAENGYVSDEEAISEDEGNCILSNPLAGADMTKICKDSFHNARNKMKEPINEVQEVLIPENKVDMRSAFYAASSEAHRSCGGNQGKAKPKFSLRLESHKPGSCHHFVSNDENKVLFNIHKFSETMGAVPDENPVSDAEKEKEKQSEFMPGNVEALAHGPNNEQSMTELVENLHGKSDSVRVNFRKNFQEHRRLRGKRMQLISKKNIPCLGDRVIDSEDSPDHLSAGSSSDCEENHQNLKQVSRESKKQTMADRFQEALGASSLTCQGTLFAALKPLGAGIYENLQLVMQNEKETDMDFLKLQGANPTSKIGFIDAKILARYLEAKLVVCRCSCYEQKSFLPHESAKGTPPSKVREKTVIFTQRVCHNVDLDVGNLVRIHPPWKEVHVGNDTCIIMSAYFSQIP